MIAFDSSSSHSSDNPSSNNRKQENNEAGPSTFQLISKKENQNGVNGAKLRPHTIHENRIPSARKRSTIHDLTNPMDATASILVSHDIYIENNPFVDHSNIANEK